MVSIEFLLKVTQNKMAHTPKVNLMLAVVSSAVLGMGPYGADTVESLSVAFSVS